MSSLMRASRSANRHRRSWPWSIERKVLSREQLLSHVWGYDYDPGSNVVDVYMATCARSWAPTRSRPCADGLPAGRLAVGRQATGGAAGGSRASRAHAARARRRPARSDRPRRPRPRARVGRRPSRRGTAGRPRLRLRADERRDDRSRRTLVGSGPGGGIAGRFARTRRSPLAARSLPVGSSAPWDLCSQRTTTASVTSFSTARKAQRAERRRHPRAGRRARGGCRR